MTKAVEETDGTELSRILSTQDACFEAWHALEQFTGTGGEKFRILGTEIPPKSDRGTLHVILECPGTASVQVRIQITEEKGEGDDR